jgi:glycosyltransferase involved in cell wall biosynthesis
MRVTENSVSIIVPTLNEEENILPLVSEIAACGVRFREILFVDDHSTDTTREKIRALACDQAIRLIEPDGAGPGLAGAIMSGPPRDVGPRQLRRFVTTTRIVRALVENRNQWQRAAIRKGGAADAEFSPSIPADRH